MARKNNLRSEASGSIHFDARTKTVMAGAPQENIKGKVQAVREVVPGKGNNEVHMVLQYYDYSVERAIQAYIEDGAKVALGEWNLTKQPNKRRKNKKKGTGEKVNEKPASSTLSTAVNEKDETSASGIAHLPNGDTSQVVTEPNTESSNNKPWPAQTEDISDSVPSGTSTPATHLPTSSVGGALPSQPLPQRQSHTRARRSGGSHHSQQEHHVSVKEVPVPEGSSKAEGHRGKPQQGLEKAIKDLHRQTTSLERLRHLLDHEIDRSYKSVKSVFEELRQGLNNREAQLMAEMNVLKQEASEMLAMRQNKAADFRKQVDRSDRLKDTDISELRAEIKHFVSERRHDDVLGRTTRFLYDSDRVMDEIRKFGQVVHVKSMYTAHSRSTSSVDSCGNKKQANSIVSHDGEAPNSEDTNHLQDRLDSSSQLQNSDENHKSGKQSYLMQNGSHNDETISSSAASSPPPPPALPADGSSNPKSFQGSAFSQNGNSFGRVWYGSNSQGPRGRGRGRGDRGLGRGRGAFNGDRRRTQHDTPGSDQRPSHTSDGGSSDQRPSHTSDRRRAQHDTPGSDQRPSHTSDGGSSDQRPSHTSDRRRAQHDTPGSDQRPSHTSDGASSKNKFDVRTSSYQRRSRASDGGSSYQRPSHTNDGGSRYQRPSHTSDGGSSKNKFDVRTSTYQRPSHTSDGSRNYQRPSHTSDGGSSDQRPSHTSDGGSSDQRPSHTSDAGSSDHCPSHTSDGGSSDLRPSHTSDAGSSDQRPSRTSDAGSSDQRPSHTSDAGSSDQHPSHTSDAGSSDQRPSHTSDAGSSDQRPSHTSDGDSNQNKV